jgi:hypothetical protein
METHTPETDYTVVDKEGEASAIAVDVVFIEARLKNDFTGNLNMVASRLDSEFFHLLFLICVKDTR